eukprot:138863-Pyramimonas_sp.AAC.1
MPLYIWCVRDMLPRVYAEELCCSTRTPVSPHICDSPGMRPQHNQRGSKPDKVYKIASPHGRHVSNEGNVPENVIERNVILRQWPRPIRNHVPPTAHAQMNPLRKITVQHVTPNLKLEQLVTEQGR